MPSAVYTSPLPRATGTAEAICKGLDIEPTVEPRLSEFEVGACILSSIEERQDLVMWRPEHRGASGETLGEFADRVAKFCDEVASRHLGSTIVLVAHAGSIDAAFRWWLGISTNAPWQFELDVSNASITELEVWPNGRVTDGAPKYAVVRRVADASHLGEGTSDI